MAEKVFFQMSSESQSSERKWAPTPPFTPISDEGKILVHPLTCNPTGTWEKLSVHQTVSKVKPLSRKTPINPNKIRFVCVSDTHNKTSYMPDPVPDGDVLLHAGDFTNIGQPEEVAEFNRFLGRMPHKRKVVIAGNHDISFDTEMMKDSRKVGRFRLSEERVGKYLRDNDFNFVKDILTNCTDYLEDSGVEICGIKIYGSPWQPWFGDWGFNLERGQPCLDKWNMIPEGTDILITHGPPVGHGDYCSSGQRAGCVELLHTIQYRVKPKYHIFGHIHEGYGITTDGFTKFINASTCTLRYKPTNPPIIFDLPIPLGFTKDDLLNDVVKGEDEATQTNTDEENKSSKASASAL